MPATNPRIFTVLERPVYKVVEAMAKKDGVSISSKARDLILKALELVEDAGLEAVVEKRRQNAGQSIPLAEVKKRYNIK